MNYKSARILDMREGDFQDFGAFCRIVLRTWYTPAGGVGAVYLYDNGKIEALKYETATMFNTRKIF